MFREYRFDHYCAGFGRLEGSQVPPPFHKGNILGPRQMQRGDTCKKAPIIIRCRQSDGGTDGAE